MPYRNRKWLFQKYVTEKKSIDKIAKETGINRSTLFKWIYKLGIPTRNLSESHKGQRAWNRKGSHWNGKYLETYINGKKILIHRIVMEKKLGRKLLSTEVVHHINHITTDNRPENLEIYSSPGKHSFEGHRHYPNPKSFR